MKEVNLLEGEKKEAHGRKGLKMEGGKREKREDSWVGRGRQSVTKVKVIEERRKEGKRERDRKKHLRKKGVFVVTETGKRRRGGEAKGKEEEEKDSLLFLISPWSHAWSKKGKKEENVSQLNTL